MWVGGRERETRTVSVWVGGRERETRTVSGWGGGGGGRDRGSKWMGGREGEAMTVSVWVSGCVEGRVTSKDRAAWTLTEHHEDEGADEQNDGLQSVCVDDSSQTPCNTGHTQVIPTTAIRHTESGRQTDREIDRQIDRQTQRHTEQDDGLQSVGVDDSSQTPCNTGHTLVIPTTTLRHQESGRQTDRRRNRQTERQTGRHRDTCLFR